MINRNLSNLESTPLTERTLSYVFGQYGADKLIPHIYEESNWHCAPGTSNCVVLDKECGDLVFDHIARHFPGALDQMRKEDKKLMEGFERSYIKKFSSDIKKVSSDRNISLGNFALMKIATILKKDYMMIFPDSINDTSMKSALPVLESYMMSHGHIPTRASQYTAKAFETMVRRAIFKEGNALSGYYAMDNVKMKDDWIFKGLNAKGEDAFCVFTRIGKRNSDGVAPQETSMKRISSLDMSQMQQLIPAVADFCKRFKNYLPAIKALSESSKLTENLRRPVGIKH